MRRTRRFFFVREKKLLDFYKSGESSFSIWYDFRSNNIEVRDHNSSDADSTDQSDKNDINHEDRKLMYLIQMERTQIN